MPLSQQIAACHRRWQWELPEKGCAHGPPQTEPAAAVNSRAENSGSGLGVGRAVSLATQHHLQATTTESSSSEDDLPPLAPPPEPEPAPVRLS